MLAGNLTAIGLAAGQVTIEEGRQDEAARVLARLAFHYLDRWNEADAELAALLRVVPVRPTVSTCLVQSAVAVEYAGGDPLYPVRYDWKGLAIDADRRPSAPVGIEKDAAERDFLLASGLEGSALEHRLFEDDLAIASVSTAKALQLAAQSGVEVLDLGPESVESVLPGLPLDEGVKERDPRGGGEGLPGPGAGGPADRPGLDRASATSSSTRPPESRPGSSRAATRAASRLRPWSISRRSSWTWCGASRSRLLRPRPARRSSRSSTRPTSSSGPWTSCCRSPSRSSSPTRTDSPCPAPPSRSASSAAAARSSTPPPPAPSASEITVLACAGGETKGPCASLKPGEAVATLRLGRKTGEIPRYTCEEPFSCTCPSGEDDCDRDASATRRRWG